MKSTISKLLTGTITEEELIELRNWLDNPKNKSELESYVRDYHDLNLATLKNNVDAAYDKVIDHVERNERPVRRLVPKWSKYAAAVLLLLGVGLLYQQGFFSSENEAKLIPKDEAITLELDNGAIQKIDVFQSKEVKDEDGNVIGAQTRNRIRYSKASEVSKTVFNTLKVPKGRQFELALSDGTSVHLNAGSSLRYPVHFPSSGPRQVFLTGEAYFNVSENTAKPFLVNVSEIDVKVLGTAFNVSAYNEDKNIEVVLVEGAVALNRNNDAAKDDTTLLTPGQKGSFNLSSKNIDVDRVNVTMYTSWMQRRLVFRNLTFDNILIKLERHYNVEIENTNRELGKEVFNASFDDIGIEEVLSFFNDTHEIDFTIENNKVIIK